MKPDQLSWIIWDFFKQHISRQKKKKGKDHTFGRNEKWLLWQLDLDTENLFQAIHKPNSCKLFIMYNKLYETCNEKMRVTCFRTRRVNENYLRRKDRVRCGSWCSLLNWLNEFLSIPRGPPTLHQLTQMSRSLRKKKMWNVP